MNDPDRIDRRFYGRRQGRPLRPGRQRLLRDLLPRVRIDVPEEGIHLDPRALFDPRPREVWLEIGFGAGEHLAAQARAHPEIGFVGCEPFVNGVAGLLSQLDRDGLSNIRVHPGDARQLLAALPDASIGRGFVLFPDPWPKARHAKRRFICPTNLVALARVLIDGAELRLASDDPGHVRWMLEQLWRCSALVWTAQGPRDWRERPDDWPATRYEIKAGRAGRASAFLRFRRTARG